jgi:hypothetical protein
MDELICTRCSKSLDEKETVYLNLDRSKDKYVEYETGEQFPFGKICAKKELKRMGIN